MKNDPAGEATVSLGRVLIDASPDKVYAKLTEARKWEHWLGVAQLVHTAQIEQLQPGNTFCYTSNLAPGFIDAIVQDAEPGKVLNWNDKALFGLVRGQSRWQLKKHAKGGRGMWLSNRLRPKTVVTLDQEVTGPLSFLIQDKKLDAHANQWLSELREACENE